MAYQQGRLLIRKPGPVPFGTCIFSTYGDKSFSQTFRYFRTLYISNIPYFIYVTLYIFIWIEPGRKGAAVVVKLLPCGARCQGFDSRSRHYDFRE